MIRAAAVATMRTACICVALYAALMTWPLSGIALVWWLCYVGERA